MDNKKILYIDMDNVIVNFPSAFSKLESSIMTEYEGKLDAIPGIFSRMEPLEGAIKAFNRLSEEYDTYILSTAPWNNPSAWSDKLLWVKKKDCLLKLHYFSQTVFLHIFKPKLCFSPEQFKNYLIDISIRSRTLALSSGLTI